MARVLFITVGTGVGVDREKKVEDLAHGLLTAIEHYKPDHIVLFGSAESEATACAVQKQFQKEHGQPLNNIDFVHIDQIDDFEHCFERIKSKINEHIADEIIIDYTSGTKTMTMTVALASLLYRRRLSIVSGKRGKNGIVIPGTEKVQEQNLFSAYDIHLEEQVKSLFNLNRFDEAARVLAQIISLPEEKKQEYKGIVEGFHSWDRFQHDEAWQKIQTVKRPSLARNKEFLGKLARARNSQKTPFLIADLLNNAHRRVQDARYDDAVARLYRVIELLAQYLLQSQYGIDTTNVDVGILRSRGLSEDIIQKYNSLADDRNVIKIAMQKDYEMLIDLGHSLGRKFAGDHELGDLLRKRNSSILAHGLTPVNKEDADRLYAIAMIFGEEVLPELPDLIGKGTFPQL